MKKFLLLASLIFVNSCALIFNGKTQNINLIPSDPSANIEVEIIETGSMKKVTLPSPIQVKRANSVITINVKENSCYKSSQTFAASKASPVSFLDVFLIIFNVFGTSTTSTDVSSGAVWSYENNVFVNTIKKPGCAK